MNGEKKKLFYKTEELKTHTHTHVYIASARANSTTMTKREPVTTNRVKRIETRSERSLSSYVSLSFFLSIQINKTYTNGWREHRSRYKYTHELANIQSYIRGNKINIIRKNISESRARTHTHKHTFWDKKVYEWMRTRVWPSKVVLRPSFFAYPPLFLSISLLLSLSLFLFSSLTV